MEILAGVILEAALAPIVAVQRFDLHVAGLLHHLERIAAAFDLCT